MTRFFCINFCFLVTPATEFARKSRKKRFFPPYNIRRI
ncbi:hypothetical protein BACUNI_03995 [Bacteroides uniformis ATCC 8492]|uniref:Uncharacterized protein n=1 Tax=Bacteroides uniformis (strain ATCC 8492 / DSM 6597 / CCUG 4942 / CIP 103695 / JCM 5828 / KCTC 5204 / NCTC 13054 / VPI 0061) TaxID=411479 RepID=A0ABC9N6I7_BACUC|nr:hypothetical protein BACUNI_03995 [Bacteroides uniformis ATCC 8492]